MVDLRHFSLYRVSRTTDTRADVTTMTPSQLFIALLVASSYLIAITSAACTPDSFQCRDGTACVERERYCDTRWDCRDGSDEENCSGPIRQACDPDRHFECSRDKTCIDIRLRCNGEVDCPIDASDEQDCTNNPPTCRSDDFRCNDGHCLPISVLCNGQRDCRDGEDERNCPDFPTCQPNEFRCRDRGCTPLSNRCNGYPDCQDSSDEEECGEACAQDQFTCGDGSCVRLDLKCDGTNDCSDGSDEQQCSERCGYDEFICDGRRCVSNSKRCDRVKDCADLTDEANCWPATPSPRVSCSQDQFACTSGDECVPEIAHCDNKYDCRDYSDEGNCNGTPGALNLKTYPSDQIIKKSREVVFQCRDEGPLRASVRWTRGNGLPLPPGSRDTKGRLEMPNIQLEHSGTYICEAVGFSSAISGSRASVYLTVEPFEQPSSPPRPPVCDPNQATCSNGECISKTQVCDGNYDCTDGSDEIRCNPHGCQPNEFRCDNKKCVLKTWRCDSDDDCGDGSDENNCAPSPPGSICKYNEYKCARYNQCIPKAFHCDMEVDCQDGSDEFGCSRVEIQKPPPSMVMKHPGEVFTISCTAKGTPVPEVVWRLNWGHIPAKCQTTSVNGYGTLTCPDIQESDQGAYSCEALNNRGPVFAIPDTILVVKSEEGVCSKGSFNELARSPAECIPCFCFGVSTSCRSADLFIYQLPPPLDTYSLVKVEILSSGGIEIRQREPQQQAFIQPIDRSAFKISLMDNDIRPSYYKTLYPYFALPENYHGNQLKSYGGYIKYTVKSDGTGSPLSIPDIILTGNGYTLVYKGSPINSRVENNIAVRFFPEGWYRVNPGSRSEYPASRQEIMMALQQVEQLLIRAQYFSDGLETTITDINMDSAAFRNIGQGQAAYVEQCDCPVGYSGLSCESCDRGFMHRPGDPWLGTCEAPPTCPAKYYWNPRINHCEPCPCPHTGSHQYGTGCQLVSENNVTCDCPPGYEGLRCEKCAEPSYVGNPLYGQPCLPRPVEPECDPAGSKSQRADSSGRCECKEYATGRTCNQCKPNTFNLASGNQFGCINCFCMGSNTSCTGSDLYRTQIVSAFTRNNQEFKLAQSNNLNDLITDVQVNPSAQEIYFQQFNPGVIYYWVLPSKFLYNKVTSYGGYLRYTLRYIPTPGGQFSRNNAPDVEIVSDSGVHLLYYNRNQPAPEPNQVVTVTVPLLEQHWERVDGAPANREQLLMALAELTYILIKATYTTNTQEAALISVSLDIATSERNTGQNRAVEVELCACPQGYRGTSCEECEAGYTRMEEGLYLGHCEPCNCNGWSTECDPDTGNCMNCRGNTEGDKCDRCVAGYEGRPTSGVPCTRNGGCICDLRGSTSSTCDYGSQCTCKTNAVGQSCSECRSGTFDLSEANPEGCIECYCSEVSSDCQSSNLYREAIPMQIVDQTHMFTLTDVNRQDVIRDQFILNPAMNEIGYDFANNQRQQRLFWSLPPAFTGNKVLSYGGFLNFTQRYSALPNPPLSFDTDVLIIGPSSLSIFWSDDSILIPDTTRVTSIPLRENKWQRLDQTTGARPASRAELMKVLRNIEAVLIRATYSTHTQVSYLSDVSLDTAVSQRTGSQVASQVEVCRCPQGYRGTSCEACSAGYYQEFDSTCKKCPCNGNEEHCALGPQHQVICTCKSTFGGTYCDRSINGTPRPTPSVPTISISITDPAVIVIEAGKDITFRCTGRSLVSSNTIGLEWSKESGDLPRNRAFDDKRGLLLIKDVQAGDSGTYICTASDGFTFVTEKALLNVGGEPTSPVVTVTPTRLNVREGEPVEFRCDATGVPTPSLQWVGDRSNRLPPQSSFASGTFRIPFASLQDEGTYTCTASNSAGVDSETVSLYVRSAPRTPAPTPPTRLSITPQDYNGDMGETVRLECAVQPPSSPRNIRLQWSRQEGELSQNARDADGRFTIYNSQPSDSGYYTCTAVDRSSGSIEQTTSVRVNVNPPQRPQPTISIEPPRQTVPQGSTAELRCITNEGPNVRWAKAGDVLPSNAKADGTILRIENIQIRDRGVYVCQVEGPGGHSSITSIVEVEPRELPKIELYPDGSQTVIEGGSVLFQCRVLKGIPEPSLHWSRVDGKNLSRQVEQLADGVLRFNSVKRSDEGQYLCTADNQQGSATTLAVLQVHSMPTITITPTGQSIKVSPGQRVRLDCLADGYPLPTVSWSKHQPGYAFYEPRSVTPENPQGAVYEIMGATRDDEGSYTCSARNAAGSVEKRVQLILSDEQTPSGPTRGDIPSTGSGVYIQEDDYTVPLGGHVTISCIAQGPQQIDLGWVRQDHMPLSSFSNVRSGVLYIQNAQHSDSGEYACQGTNSRGEVLFSAVARLRVVEPMQIKLEPERQVVRPGDNASITCTATGEQPIDISWQSASNQPLPRSVSIRGGVIEFIGIKESDAGRYVCKARNVRGTLEATADVIVNETPRHVSVTALDRNPTAMEGSSIMLQCHTPDYQEITWSREGSSLSSRASQQGSSLRIDNVQMADSGRYICRTSSYGSSAQDYIDLRVELNPCTLKEFACRDRQCIPILRVCDGISHCNDGSDESSCQIRPSRDTSDIELLIEPSNRDVHYGDTVDLRCQAVEPPNNIKFYWAWADGSRLPPNTRQTGEVLRIQSATSDNTGNYRCTAIFNNNRIDKDYYLSVHGDPPTHDAASAETVTAEYGQTADLGCSIDLEGRVNHTWTKLGGVLPSNAQISGNRLIISEVTYKDAGLYICTASNGETQIDIPKFILVRGAVPFFSQAPLSYLELPTLSNSYLNFNIDITFKPENANGLILYNGQHYGGTGDFISFGLRDGIPEFRFDVGSGTGVVRGQRPLSLKEWHTVQLSRNKKEGTMYVDENELSFGNSSGRMQGLDLTQPLFLGGVPDFSAIHKQNGFYSGFVGCISRLVFNNKEEIDIMQEQKDSSGVTSCETCAVNPCVNNGICQEAPTRSGYTCICPRGFRGLNCSHSGEVCYRGVCGSGRCVDNDYGLECYCGLGKAGDRCERDVSITEPSFTKNSYLAYPTPKTLNKIKIALKFNPADDSNGLLFYCAENDDGMGEFISLAIRDRHVEFKFNAGSGITTLTSINEIVPGQWTTVNAGMGGREARLSVSGELPVSTSVRGDVFKFTTPLYVGGYDKQRVRPAMGVGIKQGFHGCVGELQVSGLNLDLIRSVVDSANVGQCSSGPGDPCQLRPCQNNGDCQTSPDGRSYRCSCPSGFSGDNCESEQDQCAALQPCHNGGSCVITPSSYICNCPLGYAGPTCQEKTEIRTELQFNGNGYVELSKDLLPHTNPDDQEIIHIEFSTRQPNSLLLWHGQTPDTDGAGQDYMSLAVVNGYLQLSYELGSKPAFIVSSKRVDDGERHSAVIRRQAKDGSLQLDRGSLDFGESGGLLTQLNANGNIYVGGLPNIEYMTGFHSNITNFVGCIHSLQIKDSGVINFADEALSSVNVLPCPSSSSYNVEADDYDETPARGDVVR